ncbi:MAG TPA: biopolymer transporter ExbD [Thermoanaerobaculia bacterium]|nr:biopolymer transporter ExbD [Thermoanaerobaculia bacterium]
MAFQLRDEQDDVMGDINVTPLVDVMLVLLIIFMVATPMLHQGIQVALPRADARNLPLKVQDPIVLSINREGQVFLRDAQVPLADLGDRLKEQLAGRQDDTVFLKGDRGVPYGRVIEVLDRLHRSGIVHVGMVTERPPKGGRS